MKDSIGQEVNVGDYFVYAQRQGSSVWTELMQVVSIENGKVKATGMSKERYRKWSYDWEAKKGEYVPCKPRVSVLPEFRRKAIVYKGYVPNETT